MSNERWGITKDSLREMLRALTLELPGAVWDDVARRIEDAEGAGDALVVENEKLWRVARSARRLRAEPKYVGGESYNETTYRLQHELDDALSALSDGEKE